MSATLASPAPQIPSIPTVSRARRESNSWLRQRAPHVSGEVLSIGSGDDGDGEGATYRSYFSGARSYLTSEIDPNTPCDLILDVCHMPEVPDARFDAIFCSGVLEHVRKPWQAASELARVLRPNGLLLLGLPFRQAIHHEPYDYWRFTHYGIEALLEDRFAVLEISAIDDPEFPAAYWTQARRLP